MKNMDARLRRLETQTTAEDAFPRHVVLWDDDEYPANLRPQDLVVRLYHKAPSAEAWVAACKARREEGTPACPP